MTDKRSTVEIENAVAKVTEKEFAAVEAPTDETATSAEASSAAFPDADAAPEAKRRRLLLSPMEVGLCFDERMTLHTREPWHPVAFKTKTGDVLEEAPDRIRRVWSRLESAGLLQQCATIQCREVTQSEALTVHGAEHWAMLQGVPEKSTMELAARTEKSDTVYYNAHTALAARLAAGSALELCKHIVDCHVRRGFAVVRPPGHHAGDHHTDVKPLLIHHRTPCTDSQNTACAEVSVYSTTSLSQQSLL